MDGVDRRAVRGSSAGAGLPLSKAPGPAGGSSVAEPDENTNEPLLPTSPGAWIIRSGRSRSTHRAEVGRTSFETSPGRRFGSMRVSFQHHRGTHSGPSERPGHGALVPWVRRRVADELSRIGRTGNWRYVHSVPVGTRGSDIDHVLVGPGGVFTVNTKAHRDSNIWVGPNTIMVGGQRQPYLRNSRHEANRASRLLSAATGFEVGVHPVIAVVDPRNITYRDPPDDVTVVTRRGLKRWATSLPRLWMTSRSSRSFRPSDGRQPGPEPPCTHPLHTAGRRLESNSDTDEWSARPDNMSACTD